MKHVRKMKLVDINTPDTPVVSKEPSTTTNIIKSDSDENTHALSFLDQHMVKILESKDLSDFDKWTQYNQALNRYLYWLKEKSSNTTNSYLKKAIDDLRKTVVTGKNKNENNTSYHEGDTEDFFMSQSSLDQTFNDAKDPDNESDYDDFSKSDIERLKKSNTTFRKPMKAKSTKSRNFKKETADLIFKNWKISPK